MIETAITRYIIFVPVNKRALCASCATAIPLRGTLQDESHRHAGHNEHLAEPPSASAGQSDVTKAEINNIT